jgi:hypothetical protein
VVLVGAFVYALGAVFALAIGRAGEPRPPQRFVQELARVASSIAAGLREIAGRPQAGASITTYFWLRFLWSFSLVGIGFVARTLLARDLLVLVVTGGAGALGAALGYLASARVHQRAGSAARVVLIASGIAGLAVALLGGVRARVALGLLTFCLGFGFFLAKISLDGLVQQALGDGFRGRAFSLYDIAYNLAWVLAAAIMKLTWDQGRAGVLLAGMGVVFLVGLAGIGAWFRRAGLLAPVLGTQA